MTSELTGGQEALNASHFGTFTDIGDVTITATAGAANYFFPANYPLVVFNQPAGAVDSKTIELPHPARLPDGRSRLQFLVWKLDASATGAVTLTFQRPVLVNGNLYHFPYVPINGVNANYTYVKAADSSGDTRRQIFFAVISTKSGVYWIYPVSSDVAITTIVAGPGVFGQANMSASLSGSTYTLNAFSGVPVTFAATATAVNTAEYLGPIGNGNGTIANAGAWIATQPGTISQLYVKLNSVVVTTNTYTVAVLKNGVAAGTPGAMTCTVAAAASTANDIVNSFTVAVGDLIVVSNTQAGTATTKIVSWSFTFRIGITDLGGGVKQISVSPIPVINAAGPIIRSGAYPTWLIDFASSGVTPGTYGDATHIPVTTVDTYGRTTAVTSTPITFPTAVTLSAGSQLSVTGGPAYTVSDQTGILASSGTFGSSTTFPVVTANTYGKVTGVTTNNLPTLTSTTMTINSSSYPAITSNLTSGIVTPGTYGDAINIPVTTVDTYGRVTGITPTPIDINPFMYGYITGPGVFANGICAGTYTNATSRFFALTGGNSFTYIGPTAYFLVQFFGDAEITATSSVTITLFVSTVNTGLKINFAKQLVNVSNVNASVSSIAQFVAGYNLTYQVTINTGTGGSLNMLWMTCAFVSY